MNALTSPSLVRVGSASWVDEEGAYQESDDAFSQVSIGAYKLGTMIKVSEELLADSVFDLEGYISKDSISKIWDRFYKSDESRGKDKKGTGLGLSIVKEIIQAHDENINVISTPGVGTEFTFTLRIS